MSRFAYILVAAYCVCLHHGSAQLNTPPPCMDSKTSSCFNNAIAAMKPTGCNWYTIMPILSDCVNAAISGCTVQVINFWTNQLAQFNVTLNAPGCTKSCPDPQGSATSMQQCYTVAGPTGGTLSLSTVITNVLTIPSSTDVNCPLLSSILACLKAATDGCSALIDVTYQRLQSLNVTAATAVCNLPGFSAATTNAPAALFDTTTTIPATTTTISDAMFIIAGSPAQQPVSWIVLISLGGALIIVVVIVMCSLIKQININNKKRRELLLAEEAPSLQSLARRSGWRLISTQTFNGQKPLPRR